TGSAPSRLMMPLSMAALISGMTTLIATAPNLVVSSELERHGHAGFHFFAFTPFGVVVLILGMVYMVFARRWLPPTKDPQEGASRGVSLTDWIEHYKLANREYRLLVPEHSSLVGKPLKELDLRGTFGANVIAIDRKCRFSRELLQPSATSNLQADDI